MVTPLPALADIGYPGRGCLAVRTLVGELGFLYFLTGRSPASKSRTVVPAGTDLTIRDTSGARDDELRHYTAAARRGPWTVVGNGDQVAPLAAALAQGRDVLGAWSQHTFEPDPPIFTSRVWIAHEAGGSDCVVGFARRSERTGNGVDRVAWVVDTLAAGTGVLMTTYCATTDTVVATPAPTDVTTTGTNLQAVLDDVWSSLEPGLRVAAFALSIDHPSSAPIIVS